MTHDVIIVGARCAGAATAMLLARQGLRVLALDRSQWTMPQLRGLLLEAGSAMSEQTEVMNGLRDQEPQPSRTA